MEFNIIIDNKNKYLKNNKIKNFFNENINECIICYSNLDNNSIILINDFCSCFKYVFFCEKCFIKWFFTNNKCFVCRNKFVNHNNNRFEIYDIKIDSLYNKILIKIEEVYIHVTRDNLVINRTNNIFRNNDNIIIGFYMRNIQNIKVELYLFILIFIICITQYVFIIF